MSRTFMRVSMRAGAEQIGITNDSSSNRSFICPYSALRLALSGSVDAELKQLHVLRTGVAGVAVPGRVQVATVGHAGDGLHRRVGDRAE